VSGLSIVKGQEGRMEGLECEIIKLKKKKKKKKRTAMIPYPRRCGTVGNEMTKNDEEDTEKEGGSGVRVD
jgi:hypothetical protein